MTFRIQKIHPNAVLPIYAHGFQEDAGMDLCAVESVILNPMVPFRVSTGLRIELAQGFEVQIRPRSSLAAKGILIPNSPGTIDPGYRGEVKVLLLNMSGAPYEIRIGDKIAQMVVARYEPVAWIEAELGPSQRGEGGFGSTGQ